MYKGEKNPKIKTSKKQNSNQLQTVIRSNKYSNRKLYLTRRETANTMPMPRGCVSRMHQSLLPFQ